MVNTIPVLGWILSFLASVSLAVPFWICWTHCGLGRLYFGWLPPHWHELPFWHAVGLAVIASILKAILLPSLSCSCDHDKD